MEGLPLTSQRLIYYHLIANDLTPESIIISKELRDSARKARSRQRIGYEDGKEKEVSDAKKRKADALASDIKELKSEKVVLQKVQETLKNDSENLLIKVTGNAKRHTVMQLRRKA